MQYQRKVVFQTYMHVSFYVFVSMPDDLFPACSGFKDDNISIDANFGAFFSLEPPTQLRTPLSQSIVSMPIPFLTSYVGPMLLANITDGATTNDFQTEYHSRSHRLAKVSCVNSEEYGAST